MVRSAHTGLAPGFDPASVTAARVARRATIEEVRSRSAARQSRHRTRPATPMRRRCSRALDRGRRRVPTPGGHCGRRLRPPITTPTIWAVLAHLKTSASAATHGTDPVDWAGTKCLHRLHRLVQLGSHRRTPVTRKGLSHQGIRPAAPFGIHTGAKTPRGR